MKKNLLAAVALALLPFLGKADDTSGDDFDRAILRNNTKGGFYHDGRFATLADVVNHYDGHLNTGLGLTPVEKADLVEYLKSL